MKFISRLFSRKKDARILYTESLECLLDGDVDGAYRKLRELVEVDTDQIRAYIRLGDILRERERPDQAAKIHQSLTFRRRLTDDQKIEIHTSLAKDYFTLGSFSKAEDHANKVSHLDKKNQWAVDYLIEICEKQQRWKDAAEYLKRAEKVTGKDEKRRGAFFRMMEGKAEEKGGAYNDARANYIRATKIDPSYADPYLYLGNLDERENDLEKSVHHWMRFAELCSSSGKQVFDRIEKALFELGRFGQVENFYRRLVEKDSQNADALLGLIDLLQTKGEYDKALAIVDDVLSKNNNLAIAHLAHLKLALRKIDQDQLSAKVDEIIQLLRSGSLGSMGTS